MRRLPALRRMARETRLSVGDFIYPIFVTHGRDVMAPVDPMPGIFQLSLDRLLDEIGEVSELGIPAVLLFGVPARKDPEGTEAYESGGIVQEAIRVIKQTSPGADRRNRRMPVRVHRPRTLRGDLGRTGRQRSEPGAPGAHGRESG